MAVSQLKGSSQMDTNLVAAWMHFGRSLAQAATPCGLIERASRGVSHSLSCSAFYAHACYDLGSVGDSMAETNSLDRTT